MFDIGAISGQIVLEKGDWDSSVNKVKRDMDVMSEKAKEFANSLSTNGRQLSMFGSRLMMMGTVMLSPFVVSLRSASKENYAFQMRLNSLGDSFRDIQATLAKEMLPHLDRLVRVVKDLVERFRDLNPETKTAIVNFTAFTAATLLSAGIIAKIVGNLMILVSVMAKLWTILLQVIPLMAIFSTFRLMGLATDVAVLAKNVGVLYPAVMIVGSAFAGWKLGEVIGRVTGLNEALSGENGLFTKMFMWLDEKGISEKWDNFWSGKGKGLFKRENAAVGVSPVVNLEKIRVIKTPDMFDVMGNKMTEFNAGFQNGLKASIVELSNFGKTGEEIAKRTATAMGTFFSDLFFNVFTLQFEDIKQAFVDFGRSLLRMAADILSKIVMYFAITRPLVASFPALAPAFGLAEGTNQVPFTGVYKLHAGEEVKPAKYVKEDSQGMSVTIHNAIVPETVAAAMRTQEGQDTIINVIRLDSIRNGVTRRETVRS